MSRTDPDTTPERPSAEVSLPLRERQRLHRAEAILDAARALMQEVGYDAMTMDDLAARVGITKPTLYTHFASKEEIVVQAVVQVLRRNVAAVASLDPTRPAAERMEFVLRLFLESKFLERRVCLGAARVALGPTIRSHPDYRREHCHLVSLLTALIEDGKTRGEIDQNLNSRVLVQCVFSLLRDAEYEELMTAGEVAPSDLVETLLRLLSNGMRSGS